MRKPTWRERLVARLIGFQGVLGRIRAWLFAAGLLFVAAAGGFGFAAGPPGSHYQVIAYRIVLIADLAGIYLWIAVYSVLQPWWRYRIGRNLVMKDMFLSVPLLVILSSLWFNFSRLDSRVASALDLAALAAVAAYLFTRSDIWVAEHSRTIPADPAEQDSEAAPVP